MDRPAILKTSRPGVPVRFKGMCWVSIDSCSSVQWKGSQTNIHPPLFIVLINPNEQKRPKRVRTFKKWLTLGLKNGRTLGLCTRATEVLPCSNLQPDFRSLRLIPSNLHPIYHYHHHLVID